MLTKLQRSLTLVRDDSDLKSVFRVAAQAALLMIAKYRALLDECDIYTIAIRKCQINSSMSYLLRMATSYVSRPQSTVVW